jgi:hypothetical protein
MRLPADQLIFPDTMFVRGFLKEEFSHKNLPTGMQQQQQQ